MSIALSRVIAAQGAIAQQIVEIALRSERISPGCVRPQGVQCSKRGVLLLGAREEFRAKALACAESAEQATDPIERLRFLEMAEAWINLSERVSACGDMRDRTPGDRTAWRDRDKS